MSKNIADVTQRLMDIATKGEQKTIGVRELLELWAKREAAPEQVLMILQQNGALADLQVASIAANYGIYPVDITPANETNKSLS